METKMHNKVLATCTLIVLSVFSTTAMAERVQLQGTYSRDQLRSACSAAGGDFSANLVGHHCTKPCTASTGQEGLCEVNCTSAGVCVGVTPGPAALQSSSLNLSGLLNGGGSLQRR
jgi:hypothetical protein